MDGRNQDEEYQRERNYYFEAAKHISTLDVAALLILLAVSREIEISNIRWLLSFFVFSLAGATLSMVVTGLRGISSYRFAWGNIGMGFGVAFFFGGILWSIFNVLAS